MNRTRRWEFVKQDAIRLAGLGLSDLEIARRLTVDASTVFRWRKAGKLGVKAESAPRVPVVLPKSGETPAQWAATVRGAYALDAADDQMVTMAESALLIARDGGASPALRLQAMGRFQSLWKQLALVARQALAEQPDEKPKRTAVTVQRRVDPRLSLVAK